MSSNNDNPNNHAASGKPEAEEMDEVLWRHLEPSSTQMWAFMQRVNAKYGLQMRGWRQLYAWSVDDVDVFWREVWAFVGVRASRQGDEVSSRRGSSFVLLCFCAFVFSLLGLRECVCVAC